MSPGLRPPAALLIINYHNNYKAYCESAFHEFWECVIYMGSVVY